MAEEQPDAVSLDIADASVARRTGWSVLIGGVVFAAALGGLFGLLFGSLVGLIVFVVIGVPMVLMGIAERRKRIWLREDTVHQRGLGVRRVDISSAGRMEVVVADLRGRRTIGITLAGRPSNKAINITVASYLGDAGAELDILALRKLADAFAQAEHSSGLVYSQLLVAHLRAEARGAGAAERPLCQLASAAGGGVRPRYIEPSTLVEFVSGLE